ncbi:MAG: SMC family ATPase [Planctomycetes bacterium]|nr:SMC family ATPase [Planctomycetota bacterium]
MNAAESPAPQAAALDAAGSGSGVWIRSVRLLNVKSFGTGPDGQGLTLRLERGLNRIAGRNGAGKSTVIEALGYALFDCPPETGSRVELETVFVRNGASEGEIEIELATADGLYRVRRGIGKASRLRWTVRDESGFVTHETEDEVRRFLAGAFGLDDAGALPSHFRKLVGVRQGRFLDPYELSPAEARRYFAPILEVEIYQQCQQELKDPRDRLELILREVEGEIKAARARIEMTEGAEQESARLQERLAQAESQLETRRRALQDARAKLAEWDRRAQAVTQTAQALLQARKDLEHADQTVVAKRELLHRAEEARKMLDATAADHARYKQAEQTRAEIAARRTEYERWREQLSQLQQRKVAAETRAQESDRQARELREDLDRRAEALAAREAHVESRRQAFDAAEAASAPERLSAPDAELQLALSQVERWVTLLEVAAQSAQAAGRQAADANRALAAFDPEIYIRATAARDRSRALRDQAREEWARAEERHAARRELAKRLELSQQCPLLAERCRQFDRGKLVLSEVQLDEAFDAVAHATQAAEEAYAADERNVLEAEQEVKASENWRIQAQNALEELERQAVVARHIEPRQAFERLAHALSADEDRLPALPRLPDLPPPGEQPWEALAAAPHVAEAFEALTRAAAEPARRWKDRLDQRRVTLAERQRQRELEEQRLEQEAQALEERRSDLAQRRENLQAQQRAVHEALAETERLVKAIEDLARRQADIAGLDARDAEAQRTLNETAEAQRTHLAAGPEAARLSQARADLAVAAGVLERAKRAADLALKARDAAQESYDPAAHEIARNELLDQTQQFGAVESELLRDRQQLEEVLRRLDLRRKAQESLRGQIELHELVEAQRDLIDDARRILRDAGPRVAQQLVRAVTERGQRLYHALSPHDPGQLIWNHETYELSVATSSGLRRFAMLSGGQKIKAVLALQIALVQQFSSTGLCIFDEPTYGLDAESRQLLAAAVVDAQRISRFEQLIVVSHDDAFDGHVEHTVQLDYAPASGTFLAG